MCSPRQPRTTREGTSSIERLDRSSASRLPSEILETLKSVSRQRVETESRFRIQKTVTGRTRSALEGWFEDAHGQRQRDREQRGEELVRHEPKRPSPIPLKSRNTTRVKHSQFLRAPLRAPSREREKNEALGQSDHNHTLESCCCCCCCCCCCFERERENVFARFRRLIPHSTYRWSFPNRRSYVLKNSRDLSIERYYETQTSTVAALICGRHGLGVEEQVRHVTVVPGGAREAVHHVQVRQGRDHEECAHDHDDFAPQERRWRFLVAPGVTRRRRRPQRGHPRDSRLFRPAALQRGGGGVFAVPPPGRRLERLPPRPEYSRFAK